MRQLIAIFLFLSATASWADASTWTVETDAAGFESRVVLAQDALNTIKDESLKKDVRPSLTFACSPGETTVTASIDWQRFISSFSTEVGFKVDGGKFTWLKWKVDGSEKITISPSADDTRKLAGLLQDGEKLLVEVSPYSEGPVEVEFDLTGFSAAMSKLMGDCQ